MFDFSDSDSLNLTVEVMIAAGGRVAHPADVDCRLNSLSVVLPRLRGRRDAAPCWTAPEQVFVSSFMSTLLRRSGAETEKQNAHPSVVNTNQRQQRHEANLQFSPPVHTTCLLLL